MNKLRYRKNCETCANAKKRMAGKKRERKICSDCYYALALEGRATANYRPKWYLRLFGRLVFVLLVTAAILSLYTVTAQAAEPETDSEPVSTMEVTVDDITAVSAQLAELDTELDMLARLVYAEARGVDSMMEQAAVIWCVLNRYDAGYWGDSISGIIRARAQFAYSSSTPVKDNFRALAQDVVTRWLLEQRGVADVGRVLPSEYCYFAGRNGHNWFRMGYRSDDYWNWSLPDPYEATS